jgi:hypothetical protein
MPEKYKENFDVSSEYSACMLITIHCKKFRLKNLSKIMPPQWLKIIWANLLILLK